MTSDQSADTYGDRGLSPADLQNVRFTRASMLRPGYVDTEVDRVLSRVAEELGRLYAEKASLRDQVRSLQAQVDGVVMPEAPSEQAVRILSSAQQTADNYVAEAEEFSRQVTHDARVEYEELTREARETAGAILQAAHEAAAQIGPATAAAPGDEGGRTVEELQEQIAYLRTFGQSVRDPSDAVLATKVVLLAPRPGPRPERGSGGRSASAGRAFGSARPHSASTSPMSASR